MKKIDWPNHIIAFFSALLGILIAFRLEFIREEHREQEQLQKALLVIREEVDNNLSIYQSNSEKICNWLNYYYTVKDTISGDYLEINVLPVKGISTSGWESVINSGLVAKMNHDQVFALTKIYNWTRRDLGVTDDGMIEDQLDGGFDNIDIIVAYYERVCKVHKLKKDQIMPVYKNIKW
ncbi:MAG: hypothetical protein JXQ90_01360 [Cyclobacteriaceae bacterium]